jgi:hypothetical protein
MLKSAVILFAFVITFILWGIYYTQNVHVKIVVSRKIWKEETTWEICESMGW